jgi:hypothetical protein
VVNLKRSIYIDREDCRAIEDEERDIFLRGILEQLGVPLDDVWPDVSLTVEQKVKLRSLLAKLDLEIVYDGDRGYSIYHQDTKLAEWFKPRVLLREDKKARSFGKKLYYEMVIETWSMYDQQENNDEDNTNI